MSDRISGLKNKLESNPDQVFHRFRLALAYLDENHFALACKEFELCLKENPKWMIAALSLGKIYLQLEDFELAKKNLRLALELARKQNHEDPAVEAEELLKECDS